MTAQTSRLVARAWLAFGLSLYACLYCAASAHDAGALSQTITAVKPSIVGVGTHAPLRRPPSSLMGTGFVVGNGNLIATNAHVLPDANKFRKDEQLVVFIGSGAKPEIRTATVVATDDEHDLALLSIGGNPLRPLKLGNAASVTEGLEIAFTGFPIGAVLGLYPVTHTGIISAVTPVVIPARRARELSAAQITTLKNPYFVYQLDAVAYPGNSGSPLYMAGDGTVIGIINKVLVKSRKETILSDPSAITYAIPINYLQSILAKSTNRE